MRADDLDRQLALALGAQLDGTHQAEVIVAIPPAAQPGDGDRLAGAEPGDERRMKIRVHVAVMVQQGRQPPARPETAVQIAAQRLCQRPRLGRRRSGPPMIGFEEFAPGRRHARREQGAPKHQATGFSFDNAQSSTL